MVKDKNMRQEKAETAEWDRWLWQPKMAAADNNDGGGQR
jgi:hypothetical protein